MRKHPKIRALFVEKSPPAFDALKHVLNKHRGEIESTALLGRFEENIGRILDEIGSAFAFFFVDPTGWTGFPMGKLRPILQRAKGEVMINFMYDDINHFANFDDPANEQTFDLLFGTERWRKVRAVPSPDREQFLVDLYMDQIRVTGNFQYMTFTRILKPHHDRAYFRLVYATRNAKGIEKFRDVERKAVPEQKAVRERAQRKRRELKSGQFEITLSSGTPSTDLRYERDQQIRKAEARIEAMLSEGPVRYDVLQSRVLELPLVWKTYLNEILIQGHRAGRILIEGLGARERTPKAGCIIRRGIAKPS
jgi:three-Cys-motif partner protein